MTDISEQERAIELLQQFGLKEYEAKSFVALSRLPKATAREISETSEVPRTRVYDAVRVLESKGLVEIQHSNPQQFRAVSIEEATETLRRVFESHAEALRDSLRALEPETIENDAEIVHEVWSLSGEPAIAARTQELIEEATAEVVLVIGTESTATAELMGALQSASERGVDVIVGTSSAEIRDLIDESLPDSNIFVSELEWLAADPGRSVDHHDEPTISRLLLIDENALLVSTAPSSTPDQEGVAVFSRGFTNGFVAVARRLLATGLLPSGDPSRQSDDHLVSDSDRRES
jgi:sugar-specific transcriptional regulator TrmB